MRLIWIIVIILIGYGSLFPFNFDFSRELPQDLLAWLGNWEQRTIRSDLIANILLFIPFGFFGALTVQQDNRRYPILSVFWLIFAGVVYALLLQFLQFYLPSRVPHAADAVINSLGILLGISMAAYTNSHRLRRVIPRRLHFQLTPALVILALWLGWAFFPYSPVFDSAQLGKGIVNIYQSQWHWFLWFKFSLFWLAFFYSFSRVMQRQYHLGVLVAIAIFILTIKLSMFRSQLGWSEISAVPVALMLYRLVASNGQLMIMSLASLAILVGQLLLPWYWSGDGINAIQWIPFKGFLGGSTWYHLTNLLEFSLLIACLAYAIAKGANSFKKASLITLIIIILISGLQLFIANKMPDVTNIIMVVIIGILLETIDRMRRG
ncbi:VanZ family protein [Kangiella sp. TOML190]|uniref:VanZ family protein n=1 Tax=Kangiella sp. TOML190 TaxID=2931351 RepID=UPI00203E5F7A|nr:VanZ family protein [Kangiella sp. TOML190]